MRYTRSFLSGIFGRCKLSTSGRSRERHDPRDVDPRQRLLRGGWRHRVGVWRGNRSHLADVQVEQWVQQSQQGLFRCARTTIALITLRLGVVMQVQRSRFQTRSTWERPASSESCSRSSRSCFKSSSCCSQLDSFDAGNATRKRNRARTRVKTMTLYT